MSKKSTALVTAMMLTSLILAFVAGYLSHAIITPQRQGFPVLAQAFGILEDHAFGTLPEARVLEYGMIRGMIEAFGDPYTAFIEPAAHELRTDSLEGRFGGIGVRIDRGQDGEVLLYPFPDSPAALAGLVQGDRLLSVDSLVVDIGTSLETVQAALRGPVPSKVSLGIGRGAANIRMEFEIARAEIALPSVTWRIAPGEPTVGIVEINLIAESTPAEVEAAIGALQAEGAAVFVLDLRDNGGGLQTAALETAGLFLEGGVLIIQQYRDQTPEELVVESPGPLTEIPLVVLINGNTASAAEMIAGALQAHGRATIVGTPSYGKDAIQLVFELQDGSSIQVTAARWWIPGIEFPSESGGLVPDIVVSPSEQGFDPYLQTAIRALMDNK